MYHLYRHGVQSGPFAVNQLRGMLEVGFIDPEDLVWQEGMTGSLSVQAMLSLHEPAFKRIDPDLTKEPACTDEGEIGLVKRLFAVVLPAFLQKKAAE